MKEFSVILGTDAGNTLDYLHALRLKETDPFMSTKLAGFLVITVVSAVEVKVREICENSASKHNIYFGNYVASVMEKTNAKVRWDDLIEYAARFQSSYKLDLKNRAKVAERRSLKQTQISLKTSYENLLTWRNQFAHQGHASCTFDEALLAGRAAMVFIRLFERKLMIETHSLKP